MRNLKPHLMVAALLAALVFTVIMPNTAQSGQVMYLLTPDDVDRVYDGDTIYVEIRDLPEFIGHDIGIRLHGIDAPELRSRCDTEELKELERHYARQVRDELKDIIYNADEIILRDLDRDSFFRFGGTVVVDGVNVNELLLESDWVKPIDDSSLDWCEIISERELVE